MSPRTCRRAHLGPHAASRCLPVVRRTVRRRVAALRCARPEVEVLLE